MRATPLIAFLLLTQALDLQAQTAEEAVRSKEQQPAEGSLGAPANGQMYRLTTENVWLTIGHHHAYDTYLSGQLYKGQQLGLGFEQQRYYSASYPKFSKYDGAEVKMAIDHNWAQNSNMLVPKVRAFYGAHYHLPSIGNLKIMPGAYTSVDLGLKYLPHNGNNPVNAIGEGNLWLSAFAHYSIRAKRRTLRLVEHFSMGVCGLMFSPEYTQLYYNISTSEESNNLVFTSFGNRMQVRNELAIDIPLRCHTTVRLGWVAERLRYDVNKLEGRNLESLFKIGLVHNFYKFRGTEQIPENFISIEQ